jgi:hypothetical protein
MIVTWKHPRKSKCKYHGQNTITRTRRTVDLTTKRRYFIFQFYGHAVRMACTTNGRLGIH